MPKLRNLPFETTIVERYKRQEASVEESQIEMYLAGVSIRLVEDMALPGLVWKKEKYDKLSA